MKVAVCCIGRLENLYINEYIEHYLSLGVDKIFIYDNNYDEEEYFEDVIPTDLINNKVEIINFRNLSNCQKKAYQDCYDKHNIEYDWILFIDIDEYLYIEGFDNVKDFLKQDKFNNYELIHINWQVYGDNDNVIYANKPLKQRFSNPKLPFDWKRNDNCSIPENNLVKSIVRGGLKNVKWTATPHTPNCFMRCCDANGKKHNSFSYFLSFDYTSAHFKHYITKTLEEWINIKVKRGYPDENKDFYEKNNFVKEFFKVNEITEDKISYLREQGLSHLL